MRIFKRIFNAVAAVALVAAPVFGMSTANATTTFDASIAGNGTGQAAGTDGSKVTITREVNDVTNPVTNTFGYTIAADSSNNPGTATGYPTSASIAFSGATPSSGTVSNTAVVNFSGTTFDKPGDYKFKITETSTTNATDYPVDNSEWYAYVAVRNVTNSDGTPTGDFKAVTLAQGTEGNSTTKGDILFESSPNFTYLDLSKTVTGNIADAGKYFKFEVALPATMNGGTVTVTGDHSSDGTTAVTGSQDYTVANGKITIWLKHGQNVKIGQNASGVNQIPIGTQYTVTESENTDYKTYVDVPLANITSSTTEANATRQKTAAAVPVDASDTTAADTIAFNADNVSSFVNNRETDPLTGFFYNFWPYVLLLVIGMIGIYIIRRASKEEKEQ